MTSEIGLTNVNQLQKLFRFHSSKYSINSLKLALTLFAKTNGKQTLSENMHINGVLFRCTSIKSNPDYRFCETENVEPDISLLQTEFRSDNIVNKYSKLFE